MPTRESSFFLLIDAQERLLPAIRNGEVLVDAMIRFIRGCRVLGVPIVVTEQYSRGLGHTLKSLQEVLEEAYTPHDKLTFSAAALPAVTSMASSRKTVIVAGVEAHVCVYQTVKDLIAAGLEVHVLADAVGSRSEQNLVLALERFRQMGAVVSSTEMELFEWLETAASKEFKAISAIVK